MNTSLVTIGTTFLNENGFGVMLYPPYREGIKGLEGFSHIQVIWCFSECERIESGQSLTEHKPYQKAPEALGTFATRSPRRPNPIGISTAMVTYIDEDNGIIGLAWLDAFDKTPVLDIKPYIPSLDRVEAPEVPNWCSHWPNSVETSKEFDWENEFVKDEVM